MDQTAAEAVARDRYDDMAVVYRDHVAKEMTRPSIVRAGLETFANDVMSSGAGRVADVGCGPGHVTAFLADLGLDIVGIDNSPVLLELAREVSPHLRFEVGQLASLPVETRSLAGVISKHSIIHTPADLVPAVLTEFARVLAPEGLLYLSFFGAEDATTHGRPFDHAVTTAFELDVDAVVELLNEVGFAEQVRIVRQPTENERQLPHGTIIAHRIGT